MIISKGKIYGGSNRKKQLKIKMKNLTITKKELLELVLNSEFHCEPATLSGENKRISDWSDVDYILDKCFTKAIVMRNLTQPVEEFSACYGWQNLDDIMEEKECTKKEAENIFKSILVTDIVNSCLWEMLYKLPYDLPESLSLNVHIDFLGTKENIEFLEQSKLEKLNFDNRPIVSINEMESYIEENKIEIKEKLEFLDNLKIENKKEVWQKEVNSLIMQVSNNDFRTLKWKEIYNLIRSKF